MGNMDRELDIIKKNKELTIIFVSSIVLMTILLALSSYNGINGLYQQTRFTSQELDGIQLSKDLMKAIHYMQRIRGFEALQPEGKDSRENRALLAALVDDSEWLRLPQHRMYGILKTDRAQIITTIHYFQEHHAFADYTRKINDMFAFARVVVDASNLILDPNLESYYLMDISLLKIPGQIQLIGEARGKTSALIRGSKDAEIEKEVFAHAYALSFEYTMSLWDANRLTSINSHHQLEVDQLMFSLNSIHHELQQAQALLSRDGKVNEREFFQTLSLHLDQVFNVQHRMLQHLNELLQERYHLTKTKYKLSIIGLLLVLLTYVMVSFRYYREQGKIYHQMKQARSKAENALIELEKTQEAIVQSEKMAALGGLVAGVAHEINTPVGNTLSSASHLHMQTTAVSNSYNQELLSSEELESFFATALEATQLMEKNCTRAAKLIQSFKQVAVDQSFGESRHFIIQAYIEEILLSFKHQLKRSALTVELTCPDRLEMYGDPGLLAQLLTNLMSNSLIHGFDSGNSGKIFVDVTNDGGIIKIVYSDTGKGIADEIVPQIFDPFFTTKRSEGGSGLGMNIAYNIVKSKLGGDITYSKHNSGGVQFTISFPSHSAVLMNTGDDDEKSIKTGKK